MCLCYGPLRIFLSKAVLVQSIHDWNQKRSFKNSVSWVLDTNFHVQSVIYGPKQEKELMQSRAENLFELWDPSSNLYPSYKSWGSFVPLCTEMQQIPFPHATSPVRSFFWAENRHWVLKNIVLPAWQALRETPNRYCCYHKFALLSCCSLFYLIIPI